MAKQETQGLRERMNRPLYGDSPSRARVVVWRLAAICIVALAVSGVITGDYQLLFFLVMFGELWTVPDSYRRAYFGWWLHARTGRLFRRT